MKESRQLKMCGCLLALAMALHTHTAFAYTANRVFFEAKKDLYRITVEYTIPELKERRTAVIEVKQRQKAASIYRSLLSGADFFFGKNENIRMPKRQKQSPW